MGVWVVPMQERPERATVRTRGTHCPNFICKTAQCAHSASQNSFSSKLAPFFLLDLLAVMGTCSVTQMQATVTVPGPPTPAITEDSVRGNQAQHGGRMEAYTGVSLDGQV